MTVCDGTFFLLLDRSSQDLFNQIFSPQVFGPASNQESSNEEAVVPFAPMKLRPPRT